MSPEQREALTPSLERDPGVVEVGQLRQLGVRPPLVVYLRDLWTRRDLALSIPLGELKSRHMNTLLGGIWHLLNPVFLTGVYYLVFGVILDVGRAHPEVNYVAFLVVGLITFFYTQKAAMSGMKSIVGNVRLLQSLNFPRSVLPLTTVMAESAAHVPAIGVMLAFVLVTGESPHVTWLLVFPIAAVQTMFNAGLALYTARLTFHFRDMEQLLPYATRIWFYLSGVLFAAERVPEGWARTVFELNPAFVYIDLMRDALLMGETTARGWMLALVWAGVGLISGLVFFWHHETEYARG